MSLDVYLKCDHCGTNLWSSNVTHNMAAMAEEAGIYEAVWRPEKIGITRAADLVPLLRPAIKRLRKAPARFQRLNPSNGWGSYSQFVPWLEEYLSACEKYPTAVVEVSR